MTLVNIALITIIIFFIYLTYNLYKKVIKYEDTIIEYDEVLIDTINRMKLIDSTGAFQSDDEVGLVFDGIKTVLKQIEDLIYDEEKDKKK